MCEPIGLLTQPGVADGLTYHDIPALMLGEDAAGPITPRDCRASFGAVKPLRYASTPSGLAGLTAPHGRLGWAIA